MTDCSRCGDCCDPVTIAFDPQERAAAKLAELTFAHPGWVWHQWEFFRDHWRSESSYEDVDTDGTPVTVHRVRCDQFNRDTRECMAHADRPQVCSGFPWYGRPASEWPGSPQAASFSPRCSFNADVRTMLPIVEVR